LFLLILMIAGLTPTSLGQTTSQQPGTQTGAGPATKSSSKTLTIREAEAIALRNNPQITVGKLKALVAAQIAREARSGLMPAAVLSLTGVGSRAGSRIAAGYLNNPVIYPRAATGVAVSQLITDFGRATNLLASSQLSAKAENENAAATRAQILLAVDQGFYNVLESKALEKVADQTVESRTVLVEKVQALTDAKLKSDLDLSFAKVELARAKLLQLEARNNYEASRAGLSALLGYPDLQDFEPLEEQQSLNPPADDATPLIQRALQQRPEVAALQYNVEAAAKFGRAEHDLIWPTVSGLGVVGLAPVRDPHIDNWYGAAGVNVNIPIFNGFLYNARAKAADLETDVNREKLTDLRNSIARDVRTTWQQTRQAYERLDVTRQFRAQADLALELAQARYNLGLGSIVEYTQADLQKTEADIADTDAVYRYRVSQMELDYTMGVPR
jgi:outer membrane protein